MATGKSPATGNPVAFKMRSAPQSKPSAMSAEFVVDSDSDGKAPSRLKPSGPAKKKKEKSSQNSTRRLEASSNLERLAVSGARTLSSATKNSKSNAGTNVVSAFDAIKASKGDTGRLKSDHS